MTQSFEVTIPTEVRDLLRLKSGDWLEFEEREGGEVFVRKGNPIDGEFAKSVEGTLSEWKSEADGEGYCDL